MAGLGITPMINGFNNYAWSSIQISLLNGVLTAVKSIDYSDKINVANSYGAGMYPISRGTGKYEASGTLVLLMEEAEAIQRVADKVGGRLQFIPPFDIVVVYAVDNISKLTTHTLKNCQFVSNARNPKVDDTEIEISYELIISHIEWEKPL